jgi:hypothetical protein
VVAQTYANGDAQNPIVLVAFKEIIDTIEYEKNVGETLSLVQMVKTPVARKRVALAVSAAVFSTIAGELSRHSRWGLLKANEQQATSLHLTILGRCWIMLESLIQQRSFK